jgi:H+/Cl- antiporter ClcA/CBS domain-containing protein
MKTTHLERGDFAADPRILKITGMAVVIGAAGAAVAWILLALIRLFTNLFFAGRFSMQEFLPSDHALGAWVIAVPVAGSLIIGLMARYGSERIRGHGIPEALEAILFGKSLMNPKVAVLKPLSSAISIGSGGPFGAEGPIIMTGGAFGSLFAQSFRVTDAERKTLLVCGAAAGMTAIFATPIAAVLLAVELLLFEWRPRSLVPVSVAAAVAFALRGFIFAPGPLFPHPAMQPLPALGLLAAALLGVLSGAFAGVISNGLYRLEDLFAKLPFHWMWWPALGGLAVGIGGWIEPRVLGVGYGVITDLLQGTVPNGEAARLAGLKALVWIFALASGTSGGVLAPLLIMGAGLGSVVGHLLPVGEPSLWALVGLASILGGMMRSPMMATVFALELTADVSALPPIFIGVVSAYAFTVLTMKRSILTEKIARRGYDLFREYAVDPLERLRVKEVMSSPVDTIEAGASRAEVEARLTAKRRGFPVVDSAGTLVGMICASDLIRAAPGAGADGIASRSPVVGHPDESCRALADRMARHSIGRIPVVERGPSPRLLGIVTRSDLLKARARSSEEESRSERFLNLTAFPLARTKAAKGAP